MDEVTVHRNE